MKTLVTGGTGMVGSGVVRELMKRHVEVSVLTRDPSKASLPEGVKAVAGDLSDPGTVTRLSTFSNRLDSPLPASARGRGPMLT